MSQTNQTNSINTAHDIQLAACLAAAEGVTAAVSDEADSVARRQIVALRQRYEELSAAMDRISTASRIARVPGARASMAATLSGWSVTAVASRSRPSCAAAARHQLLATKLRPAAKVRP